MNSDCIRTLKLGGDEDEYTDRDSQKTKMTCEVVGGNWVLELDLRGRKCMQLFAVTNKYKATQSYKHEYR